MQNTTRSIPYYVAPSSGHACLFLDVWDPVASFDPSADTNRCDWSSTAAPLWSRGVDPSPGGSSWRTGIRKADWMRTRFARNCPVPGLYCLDPDPGLASGASGSLAPAGVTELVNPLQPVPIMCLNSVSRSIPEIVFLPFLPENPCYQRYNIIQHVTFALIPLRNSETWQNEEKPFASAALHGIRARPCQLPQLSLTAMIYVCAWIINIERVVDVAGSASSPVYVWRRDRGDNCWSSFAVSLRLWGPSPSSILSHYPSHPSHTRPLTPRTLAVALDCNVRLPVTCSPCGKYTYKAAFFFKGLWTCPGIKLGWRENSIR